MIRFQRNFLASILLAFSFAATASGNVDIQKNTGGELFGRIQINKLLIMPDTRGHIDWIDAIRGAKSSIHMEMYHLTDKDVMDALISRAKDRSFDLRIIVDQQMSGGNKKAFDALVTGGVQIRTGSTAFSLTHSKTMVIDGKTIFIGAINMTNTAQNSRDFGIITEDSKIIDEVDKVFEADWINAQSNTSTTPTLTNNNLAWSPNNSTDQLIKLVDSATSTLEMESENFSSDELLAAFNRAATRGVQVRLIIPECVFGGSDRNYSYLAKLQGVQAHVEHDGKSMDQPYMHSKMMVVDRKTSYVGSINFSFNSTQKARELGVIFLDEPTSSTLSNEFQKDWNRSQVPNATPSCGKSGGETSDLQPAA